MQVSTPITATPGRTRRPGPPGLRPAVSMLLVGVVWNLLVATTPVSGASGSDLPAPKAPVSERSPAR